MAMDSMEEFLAALQLSCLLMQHTGGVRKPTTSASSHPVVRSRVHIHEEAYVAIRGSCNAHHALACSVECCNAGPYMCYLDVW